MQGLVQLDRVPQNNHGVEPEIIIQEGNMLMSYFVYSKYSETKKNHINKNIPNLSQRTLEKTAIKLSLYFRPGGRYF